MPTAISTTLGFFHMAVSFPTVLAEYLLCRASMGGNDPLINRHRRARSYLKSITP